MAGTFLYSWNIILLSSAYHPATDGQTEVVNRYLETYLRCMCTGHEKDWSSWLPLAEWWYNTHFHTAIQITPYEIVYGQPPPLHLPYLAGEVANADVDRSLQRRESVLSDIKQHLVKVQNRMKNQVDKHRSVRTFKISDWVWLKLQPYRQRSVHIRVNQKLSPKFYGPFHIIEVIGKVAYKLNFPSTATNHDVFHVSQLKAFYGNLFLTVQLPSFMQYSTSSAILDRRVQKVHNAVQVQFLVQWEGYPVSEATWEAAVEFVKQFPDFNIN